MNRTRLIRIVSSVLIVVLLLDYAYSGFYVPLMGGEIEKLMSLNGFGSIVEPAPWMFHSYYLSSIAVLGWLVYRWQSARLLYIILIAVTFLSVGLFGASIAIPSQVVLAMVEAYLTGALLLLLIVPLQGRSGGEET